MGRETLMTNLETLMTLHRSFHFSARRPDLRTTSAKASIGGGSSVTSPGLQRRRLQKIRRPSHGHIRTGATSLFFFSLNFLPTIPFDNDSIQVLVSSSTVDKN